MPEIDFSNTGSESEEQSESSGPKLGVDHPIDGKAVQSLTVVEKKGRETQKVYILKGPGGSVVVKFETRLTTEDAEKHEARWKALRDLAHATAGGSGLKVPRA